MNQKQKELVKVYIVLFFLIFLIMNWGMVSWMFSYRALSGLAYDFFNPYQDGTLLVSANNAVISNASNGNISTRISNIDTINASNPNSVAVNSATANPATMVSPPVTSLAPRPNVPTTAVNKSYSIEIPKIGIVAPIVLSRSTDGVSILKDLDKGVVYYPGSPLPTQNGHIIMLGHSAPPNWPKIKHDWVFSKINNLVVGDQVIVYFDNVKYVYKVINKNIINKGEEIKTGGLDQTKNILTLVSCWPPGKDYQRIAVQAELVR